MHAMLNQDSSKDYVIGIGVSHSVAEFSAHVLTGINKVSCPEEGLELLDEFVEVDARLLRTGKIHDLPADAGLAREELIWQPEIDFRRLLRMMVDGDLSAAGITKPHKVVAAV